MFLACLEVNCPSCRQSTWVRPLLSFFFRFIRMNLPTLSCPSLNCKRCLRMKLRPRTQSLLRETSTCFASFVMVKWVSLRFIQFNQELRTSYLNWLSWNNTSDILSARMYFTFKLSFCGELEFLRQSHGHILIDVFGDSAISHWITVRLKLC